MTESASSTEPDPEGQADPSSQATGDLQAVEAEVVDAEHAPGEQRIVQASAFSGPLPPPDALREYDEVVPGLAREIVEQWKRETSHRHRTIDGMRQTDDEAMKAYYVGEKRGQSFALICYLGLLVLGGIAIVLDREAAGVAAILAGGAAVVWSMRRNSMVPGEEKPPVQVDGDAVESTPPPNAPE